MGDDKKWDDAVHAFLICDSADRPKGEAAMASWAELADILEPVPGEKAGVGWSPGKYAGDYRKSTNFLGASLVVYDLDGLGPLDNLAPCVRKIEDAGVACLFVPSYTVGSWRLIFPLAKECSPARYPGLRDEIAERFAIPAIDPVTKDLARFYFFPRHADGEQREASELPGDPIDFADSGPVTAPVVTKPKPPPPSRNDKIDLSDYRQLLKAYKGDQRHHLDKIGRNEPLLQEGSRENTLHALAGALAYIAPHVDVEVALAYIEPSLHQSPVEPEGFEYFARKFRDSYRRAVASKLEGDSSLDNIKLRLVGEAASPEETRIAQETPDVLLDSKQKVRRVGENVRRLVLRNPAVFGRIRWNEVAQNIETSGPMAHVNVNALHTEISNRLQSEFSFDIHTQTVAEQLYAIARNAAYNPVKEYLTGLKWDGAKRLDNWLATYLRVEPRDETHRRYLSRIGRAWLVQAVARGMNPGCEAHTMLILKGPQGAGKSAAAKALGGPFHINPMLNLADKDARQVAARCWILEVEELAAFSNARVELLKQFITTATDTYRPPYGKAPESFPRMCVMLGTTNNDDLFRDDTGYRRFWVVETGRLVDYRGLYRDRDALWAEAVQAFQTGETYFLNTEELRYAESEAAQYATVSDFEEPVSAWWFKMKPQDRPSMVFLDTVMLNAGIHTTDATPRHRQQFGRALHDMGFLKRRAPRTADGRQGKWYYEPTAALKNGVSPDAGAKVFYKISSPNEDEDTGSD